VVDLRYSRRGAGGTDAEGLGTPTRPPCRDGGSELGECSDSVADAREQGFLPVEKSLLNCLTSDVAEADVAGDRNLSQNERVRITIIPRWRKAR
jgi:hypothetical protein